MKIAIFGTAWVTAVIIAYIWMGLWCGYEFGGANAGLWFFWGLFPTGLVGALPLALYIITEDK